MSTLSCRVRTNHLFPNLEVFLPNRGLISHPGAGHPHTATGTARYVCPATTKTPWPWSSTRNVSNHDIQNVAVQIFSNGTVASNFNIPDFEHMLLELIVGSNYVKLHFLKLKPIMFVWPPFSLLRKDSKACFNAS